MVLVGTLFVFWTTIPSLKPVSVARQSSLVLATYGSKRKNKKEENSEKKPNSMLAILVVMCLKKKNKTPDIFRTVCRVKPLNDLCCIVGNGDHVCLNLLALALAPS